LDCSWVDDLLFIRLIKKGNLKNLLRVKFLRRVEIRERDHLIQVKEKGNPARTNGEF
jgi:hypothetical protein